MASFLTKYWAPGCINQENYSRSLKIPLRITNIHKY